MKNHIQPSAPPEILYQIEMIEYEKIYREQFIDFKYLDEYLKIQLDNVINQLITALSTPYNISDFFLLLSSDIRRNDWGKWNVKERLIKRSKIILEDINYHLTQDGKVNCIFKWRQRGFFYVKRRGMTEIRFQIKKNRTNTYKIKISYLGTYLNM